MTQALPPLKKMSIKTFALFIAIWLVVMIAVFAGSAIYNNYKGQQYRDTAVPYLLKIIPELSQWNPQQIKGLMADEALKNIPDDNFLTMVNFFSRLGELQRVDTPVFEKTDTRLTAKGTTQKIVEYSVETVYENGDALLNIRLIDLDGSFAIYHFSFGSAALSGK